MPSRVSVSSRWKSSLDFACHSAACAPPPVGTGGSTDGGSAAEDYRGYHQPNSEGPRAHNLIEDEMVPGDVYEHPEWYTGYPKAELRETMAQLRAVRGKPNAELTIYRALPAGVKGDKIRPGDWVSLSKSYARQHLDGPLMGEGEIASLKVPAHTVRWAIDDLTEWGYFPNVQASAAEELGCQDASCAPPPVGTGGSRPKGVAPGYKMWWRMSGGSTDITSGAYDLMAGGGESGRDAQDAAAHMIDAVNSQPIKTTRMFSGHIRDSLPEVGDVIDVPLMALAHARGLAMAYARVDEDPKVPHPTENPRKNHVLSVFRAIHEAQNPGVPKTDRELWDEGNPEIRKMAAKSYRAVGPNSHRSVRTVYEFESSRSALIDKGLERVTSGRYRVTGVETKPIRGQWVFNIEKNDFEAETYSVVKLAYVEPILLPDLTD